MLTFGATFKQNAEKFKVKPAVIGVPNPIWGESVKAVGVLKEGTVLSSEEIIEFLLRKTSKRTAGNVQ
ncbi:acyl-CoA ligase [Alkalihalophilus pseudofirmus OF4]|uniref:Acyl-CoA ligase n=1 Tax=Alkalihalophilus pseudofirmus (strain ATCC BAA-2126 / JCM 17055 / OF4) TaxID=398511 RepID=D3FTJ1_ALKPO|nr:acyl--CoA ligase [Alkalihalophilus pseudofirmus]ADC50064.1 acyl-CoA ligase [Alkalihalophilus pseudofirmus OF4]